MLREYFHIWAETRSHRCGPDCPQQITGASIIVGILLLPAAIMAVLLFYPFGRAHREPEK